MKTTAEQISSYADMVNSRLESLLKVESEYADTLWKAMYYSVSAGGKRIRPAMFLAVHDMFREIDDVAVDFACAVEMIHTYSLIHDDLPGMDNDCFRRGKPTNHMVFGEGQAILAGDGLLNYAFETMLNSALIDGKNSSNNMRAISEIIKGAGVGGMIAGQCADLKDDWDSADAGALDYIQIHKTSCMFMHPMRAAAIMAGGSEAEIDELGNYGKIFGLIFQATDDLLDELGDQKLVGKTLGKDRESGKLTCISVYGMEGTRERVNELRHQAMVALKCFGKRAWFFIELLNDMVNRVM